MLSATQIRRFVGDDPREFSRRGLDLKPDAPAAEKNRLVLSDAGVDDGREELFHADGRTSAVNIAGQREQVFRLQHFDVFLSDGVRCPFEVELLCHGDEKNIVSAAFANGDEGLVDVRGILPERGGDIGAGDDPLLGVGREYDLFLLEQAYRIGFLFCFFHLLLRKMRRRGGSAPV